MTAQLQFDPPISGPAYRGGFRVFATIAVLALLGWGARVLFVLLPEPPGRDAWILLGAAAFALIAPWYFMLTARTTIDATGIRQSGLIERRTDWNEIRTARVRGPWFSRRLVVRGAGGRRRYYYAGTPQLQAALDRIAAAYPQRRPAAG